MATVVKDFKIKSGLLVEGTTGKINNFDILTKKQADQDYIIGLIGGTATSTNTANAVVKRDGSGNFAAGTITADLTGDVTGTVSDISNHDTGDLAEGTNLYFTNQRALDATSAAYDPAGSAQDVQENLDSHTSATSAHGVTGNVVGTSDSQTLTNKTLGSGTNLSVNLDMNGNNVQDLGTPVAGTDATTKNYVDDADTATLGSANEYTDDEITALDTSLRNYADQAEVDAKAYTDTRETAITNAYQSYADQAEADAITSANAYTDQAELDAIDAAATAAAALYAPLAGATFTGDVILNADPSQALGAATKQYVDSVAEGLHIHASAVAATTANVNLATGGLLEIDGVQLVADNRVLVKSQTDAEDNGIYLAKVGAWVRAEDFDAPAEVDGGDFIFVTGGNSYGNTGWVQTSTNVVTIGTDPIAFTQFSGAGTYLAGTGLELNGNTFEIDDTYTATKSYVDGEIDGLDTAAQGYADTAEQNAKDYTDDREDAITLAYQTYADQAETDAKSHADSVAETAENNANSYTDGRETAITTAYQNYADLAEADAKLYTDNEIDALDTGDIEEGSNLYFTNQRAIDAVGGTIGDAINALDTDDIEEGVTNLYYTESRAKTDAAELLTGATLTNITITGNGSGLTITAENGVADSDTDDLDEGTNNLYFTDQRAVDALQGTDSMFNTVSIDEVALQVAATLSAPTAGVQTAYAWAHDDYRSAEFLVKVAYGTHTEISKVLLTLDASENIAITEYGIVGTNGSASTISAGISGTDVQLLVTTANNSSTVTVVGTLLA
jgi:hypothetical protein